MQPTVSILKQNKRRHISFVQPFSAGLGAVDSRECIYGYYELKNPSSWAVAGI